MISVTVIGGAVLHSSETHISTYIAADMSFALRTKVFEGNIRPQVQQWIADNPLRRHDQTLDFHRWWQIIMGYPLADASTRETEPDYRILVLKVAFSISTTYMWTSQEHASTKSYIETVAWIRKDGKTHMAASHVPVSTASHLPVSTASKEKH